METLLNHLEIQTEELVELLVEEKPSNTIVIHNDDVHTFDYVIDALVEICEHDPIQAEQCTFIIHYNGKCAVKKGTYEALEPVCNKLLDKGLSAEIV